MNFRFFIIFIILPIISNAQSNYYKNDIAATLTNYSKNYPEKIYIHTDKPYYSLGENIWFNAYLVNGITHTKTTKSRIIYTELINENDSIVSKHQLYTDDISVAGDFKIDKNWKPGNYTIRAYTNYMRNVSSDYFFKKELKIWNPITSENKNIKESDSLKPVITQPELSFYPEGGYLINGIKSKIGLKVKGIGDQKIEGVIKDSDNTIIMPFKTYDYGLGLIAIIPQPNKSYYAEITYNTKTYTYKLPKALTNGYHLNVEKNKNTIFLSLSSTTANQLKGSYLLVHQRGLVLTEKTITELKSNYTLKLDTKSFPDGVTSFVLFDNYGRPVAERLVFINNPENNIETYVSQSVVTPGKRQKVDLNINIKDVNKNLTTGKLSVSITDLNIVAHNPKAENIKTYLLLNSDLRGQLKNPGYFFEEENDIKRKHLLDLVMLTHGWRRFTWKEIEETSKARNKYPEEKGLFISGHTASLKNTGINIPAETRLTFKGYELEQELQKSNANGKFKYGPYMISDSIEILLEARIKGFNSKDKKNRNVSIFVDKQSMPKSPEIKNTTTIFKESINSNIIDDYLEHAKNISLLEEYYSENARLLDEVLVVAKKKTEKDLRNELLDEQAEYGFPTRRLDLNDIKNSDAMSIFQLLNYLPGVSVYNDSIRLRNRVPRIIVDGLTYESSDVANISGNEVEFIDVLTGADAAYFSNAGNGVIVIHLKRGISLMSKNIKRAPGIINFMAYGFYTAREFYAPNYLDDFEEVTKPDYRSTLHWEPKIELTKSNPSASLSFFTSDSASTYAIKIEGITDSGIPIVYYTTFNVD